jgi:hypothetical protein
MLNSGNRQRIARILLSISIVAALPDHASAENVLILSNSPFLSTPERDDNLLQSVLQAYGNNVTFATSFVNPELEGKDVVVLNFDGDMPIAGQQALLDFVSKGGGLIANAWIFWQWTAQVHDYFVGGPGLENLGVLFPIQRKQGEARSVLGRSVFTLTQATPAQLLTRALPQSFSFMLNNLIYGGDRGSEACLVPQMAATVFYVSEGSSCGLEPMPMTVGLVGWRFGQGHVLQFSTLFDPIELADATYGHLLANAVTWAGHANRGPLVTELRFERDAVGSSESVAATFLGEGLTDNTYFDLRLRLPGSTTNEVVFNWQQGTSVRHTIPLRTGIGVWTVTGARAHQSKDDHTAEFDPVSAFLTVVP